MAHSFFIVECLELRVVERLLVSCVFTKKKNRKGGGIFDNFFMGRVLQGSKKCSNFVRLLAQKNVCFLVICLLMSKLEDIWREWE